MSRAAVGQKVICLWDWTQAAITLKMAVPKQGETYRVRAVVAPNLGAGIRFWAYRFAEIRNELEPGAIAEPSFNAAGFEIVS